MKKFLLFVMIFSVSLGTASAQGLLKRIKDKAKQVVEDKIENKVEREVSDAADEVLDGTSSSKSKASSNDKEAGTQQKKTAKSEAVTNDFVPGTVVIFEDNLINEKMGEFPSKWELLENNAEVARMNGKNAIKLYNSSDTRITPLIKDGNRQYLPDFFTLEFDFFITGEEGHNSAYWVKLIDKNDEESATEIHVWNESADWFVLNPSGSDVRGNKSIEDIIKKNDWNHFALSFNKRALKVYINNVRVVNIPNAKAKDWLVIQNESWEDHIDYVTNIRLAKGGVELYGQNASDLSASSSATAATAAATAAAAIEKQMKETGQFVTNNILFETGKADLKQESMIEIMRVADYMKKNPSVRFEVQGHCDNQGSDAVNDPLSQARAEAIVKSLIGLGVDEWNLKAVGKGSHEPVADNKTEEGRAKNRRVVFVKK